MVDENISERHRQMVVGEKEDSGPGAQPKVDDYIHYLPSVYYAQGPIGECIEK